MRWLPYILLAYIALGVQVGIAGFVTAPNLGLIAVMFVALNAPREAALLGCFGIGFLQDLLTAQQPGLYAFSYGLVALLIVNLTQIVSRTNPIVQFVVALVGGFMVTIVLLVHSWIHPAGPALVEEGRRLLRAVGISAGTEFTRMFYTALLAPVLLFALGKIRGLFAFQPGKNRVRRW